MTWIEESNWEKNWWGMCLSTAYGETTKQLETYAPRMGLKLDWTVQGPYIRTEGLILDVGGGPCSMLLLSTGYRRGVVIDPCDYPNWVAERYKEVGIQYIKNKAENIPQLEELGGERFDEVWIYNVLQHVDDPELIVRNIRAISKIIRVFDWLEVGIGAGHPHNLHKEEMDKWYGGTGKVVKDKGGLQYFGVFLGDHYGK